MEAILPITHDRNTKARIQNKINLLNKKLNTQKESFNVIMQHLNQYQKCLEHLITLNNEHPREIKGLFLFTFKQLNPKLSLAENANKNVGPDNPHYEEPINVHFGHNVLNLLNNSLTSKQDKIIKKVINGERNVDGIIKNSHTIKQIVDNFEQKYNEWKKRIREKGSSIEIDPEIDKIAENFGYDKNKKIDSDFDDNSEQETFDKEERRFEREKRRLEKERKRIEEERRLEQERKLEEERRAKDEKRLERKRERQKERKREREREEQEQETSEFEDDERTYSSDDDDGFHPLKKIREFRKHVRNISDDNY